jgi:hypothetical protein
VTDTYPYPGSATAVPCSQNGSPVTTLGARGTATDTCTGSYDNTAPACAASDTFPADFLRASGTNAGTGAPFSNGTGSGIRVLACTPTPTPTP